MKPLLTVLLLVFVLISFIPKANAGLMSWAAYSEASSANSKAREISDRLDEVERKLELICKKLGI